MTHRADRASAQHPPSRDIDPATRRILARVAVSDSVAKVLADLAFRPSADSWQQRGRA